MSTLNTNHALQIIDLLQIQIRNGCSVPEFIKQMSRLVNAERQLATNEESKSIDPKN
jgi:hypothetical protein